MPTLPGRHRQRVVQVTDCMRVHLATGLVWDFLDGRDGHPWTEQGNGNERQLVEMREVWQTVRDELIAEEVEKFPCKRPWAFWRVDAQRDESRFEAVQLHEMRQLTADELERAQARIRQKQEFAWTEEQRAIMALRI